MTKFFGRTILAVALLVAASPAWAGDAEQGRILSARCAACHGPTGVPDSPMIPKLAGQNGTYLYQQLLRFKEGVRLSPLMSPIATALTSTEMDHVATYFAGLSEQVSLAGTPQQAPKQTNGNH